MSEIKTQLLTVTKVSDLKEDKNGRQFKVVTFGSPQQREVLDVTTGELRIVRMPARTSSISRYEESYLNDQPHYMFDAVVGELIPGEIVSASVEPYGIDDKIVSTYTTVVLGLTGESTFAAAITSAFKAAGHPIDFVATPAKTQKSVLPRVNAVKEEVSQDVEEMAPVNDVDSDELF